MEYMLEMNHIDKRFPGVQALSDVTLKVKPGEVHVLLGENGAGKSTLVKILAGVYRKDAGEIILGGQKVDYSSTNDASKLGISMIYQELNMIPDLTVAENIFINREHLKGWPKHIDWEKMNSEAAKALKKLNANISPTQKARRLTTAQKQMVEIARAISADSRIIIMDEPTASLTEKEIAELFRQIRLLSEENVSIIYISHRLNEVKEIGDRVTVLRDGQYIGTRDIKEADTDDLIQMMVGREITQFFPKCVAKKGKEALRVENLSRKNVLHDISFSVHEGEVLGFSGLIGSGRTELMRAIYGADGDVSGRVYVDGKEAKVSSPKLAVQNGIAFLTEDRKNLGAILSFPIYQNITLASMDQFSRNSVIDHQAERSRSEELFSMFNIKAPSIDTVTRSLSGGNQQKVLLARWFCRDAKIIILDEPTRGIDVGSKVEIYEFINELAGQGKAIIMVSSDLPEVLAMSDRIAVMREGRLTGILDREEATQEKIMKLATLG
jgi:ABC-type sugar transport system ATPase subunit